MRVAQIARLTGTTVRTVRHYHALGLLPVPPERGGWRDYELAHVARLSRIRWLVQAGMPLSAVARVLQAAPGRSGTEQGQDPVGPQTGSCTGGDVRSAAAGVVEDLRAALSTVEAHLEEAARQRDMLRALLERAEDGLAVSPMPPRMAAFFDRMERDAPDERTRAAVRHDRDIVDLACYRGQMPPEAEHFFPEPDAELDAATLAAYGSDLESATAAELAEHADWLVTRLEDRLTTDELRDLANQVDTAVVSSLFRLIAGVCPHSTRVARFLEERLLAAIEHWRTA